MSFKSWESYNVFSSKVRNECRYIHDINVKEFLSNVIETSKKRETFFEKGSIFWRAQLGNSWHDVEEISGVPTPFPPARMKPIPYTATEGRANPKGIPYLYLSNNKETAMSEVRPWLGSNISVGQFQALKELHLINCSVPRSKGSFYYLEEPDPKERELLVWAHIDNAFSQPVDRNDTSSDYVPTQIIAELFKSEGFDGVVYKSALSDGFNIALFNIDTARMLNCFLYETREIKFMFSESANPYSIKK